MSHLATLITVSLVVVTVLAGTSITFHVLVLRQLAALASQ